MKKKFLVIVLLGLVIIQAWANGSVLMNNVSIRWGGYGISLENLGDNPVTVTFVVVYRDGRAERTPRTVHLDPRGSFDSRENGYVAELANIQVQVRR
jgi:hypothetical protein